MTRPDYEPKLYNDPLIGTQEHPDQKREQQRTPHREAAADPTHGQPRKSRFVAGAMGLIVGFLGIHRFYLGFPKIGGFQLALSLAVLAVVFTVAIATDQPWMHTLQTAIGVLALIWLWGVIEGVMILMGMMRHDGHAHPLR
jgi:TM2 domain-containing membrane protein YozV